ncbi:MAG TPA: plastocyanin/azurin family copper-binding protein [Chitinophagales bacterium]|nr:plastocyanin/azurin family copper-binding protein [Chitinophagales bacterium]
MKKILSAFSLPAILLLIASCGEGPKQENQSATSDTSVYVPEQPVAAYDPDKIDANAPVMEITLEALGNSMDVMAFSTSEIRVKSSTTVKIHFVNKATDAAMKHNFFIVKDGTAESVAMAANTAGPEKNFVPDDKANVLYTSKVLEPGSSEDLVFAAPPSGTYQFVCTYPGHWQKMNGKFVVE